MKISRRSVCLNGKHIDCPFIWVGQSVDTSVLTARVPSMRDWPMLVSLADAFRRPRYADSHFNENLREQIGVTGPVMLDSGGFVLMRRKSAAWTPSRVADVYRRVDADILVSLDLPPLPDDSTSTRQRKRRKTLRNLESLADELAPRELMPVVHGHTTRQIAAFCSAVRQIYPEPKWIGVGGMVPLLKQIRPVGLGSTKERLLHLANTIVEVREQFPNSLIHVFGAGAPRSCLWVFAMGATSVDSHSWRQAAGFGSIFLPAKGQRILKWNRKSRQRSPLIDDGDRDDIAKCSCPYCRHQTLETRVTQLTHDFEARSIHNLWTLDRESKQLRKAIQNDRIASFLESRLAPAWIRLMQERPHRLHN